MDTNLQTRTGESIHNPTSEQLQAALAQLDPDPDHYAGYDAWLTGVIDGNDWVISALDDGSVTLTIFDYSGPPGTYRIYDLLQPSPDTILEIWQELQLGEGSKIQARPWRLRS